MEDCVFPKGEDGPRKPRKRRSRCAPAPRYRRGRPGGPRRHFAQHVARLEKGDPGVGIGVLAGILVVLGLVERLADLIDIRKDDLGLALASEQLPRRGRTYAAKLRKRNARAPEATVGHKDIIDPDGAAF
jgi:hypothetical protein